MSFRNRPILDRKHRPRWQDELRTQQLTVAGFALAIAVAIGIFAAAAWSTFYEANLRQVAFVGGASIESADLARRTGIVNAELSATLLDLQHQSVGGAKDTTLDQQIQVLQSSFSQLDSVAGDSLVNGAVMTNRAPTYGITVTDDEISAEIERRWHRDERRELRMILVTAKAPAGKKEFAAAKTVADRILAEINAGADFAAVAAEKSEDPATKSTSGLLGWIEPDDATYQKQYEAAGDAGVGTVLGPLRSEAGWYLLKVEGREPAQRDVNIDDFLAQAGISDAEYREYIREEVLRTKFRDYFNDEVVTRFEPQRDVAEIFLNKDDVPLPKVHVRHLLAQPLPGAKDQSKATKAQWRAALERAKAWRVEVQKPDADWFELAKQSDDGGSRDKGGDLGWYEPSLSNFAKKFKAAIAKLSVGDVSPPVKTQFGYHIIEVTQHRDSANELAARLVTELRKDPQKFAEVAEDQSEHPDTAQKGGVVGWIARYELEQGQEDAIFGLQQPGDISDPVVTTTGIFIYKLLDSSESRFVPEERRSQIQSSGFTRWQAQLKGEAGVWTAPELAPAPASAPATG
jgi:parvulin-like peptidyl-prolyl isomerase